MLFESSVHGVIGYVNYYISIEPVNQQTSTTNSPNIIVIDRWALVVFTILFFAYQIATIIWICLVLWKKRRKLYKKDYEHRLYIASISKNSTSTF